MSERYDAVIVGSGPNGLAAAIELARNDLAVLVIEGADAIGGGTRTATLTLPGYLHDVCSAAHPFAIGSPFLAGLPLADHGLEWINPPAAVAHPLDGRAAVLLERSVEDTSSQLGRDANEYVAAFSALADRFGDIAPAILGPLLRLPSHPLTTARFGVMALQSAVRFAERFDTVEARALLAGLAAHSILPLDRAATNGVGIALGLAGHAVGWPIAKGGSAALTDAMGAYLVELGGEIRTGHWVKSLDELPTAAAVLLDVMPDQLADLAADRLSAPAKRRLRRWEYGPGSFKVDFALSNPVPWEDPQVQRSATVHVGGSLEDIAVAEAAPWEGRAADRPFVLLTQPTLFDETRAPDGGHVVWAYCHVPSGWDGDATEAITAQIERFAPSFRDTILAAHSMGPAAYERYNPNNVGGAIGGGAATIRQIVARPRFSPFPHATPLDNVYLCSSATAPGAGTHGMCGFHAARTALRKTFR
ncbi:MAG TPA: NAD(P)/FAD-dependent oxidoreductase [Acidimicrobiia bacterium]|jgi:phytoene dehydrogenase-like protein|nr:NAD(P)/FAD-dependent oxidoreductase [Acidimicrobiia bacterium]